PIPLLPRPAPMPGALGAVPARPPGGAFGPPGGGSFAPHGAAAHDPDGGRLTVPDLVPPTVRYPSLSMPPAARARGAWPWVAVAFVVLGVGALGAWLIVRGLGPEPERSPKPGRTAPAAVEGAPPTPVESGRPPFPEASPPPRASGSAA